MWGPILEKAWAKMKGTYDLADGGFDYNGLAGLTGYPTKNYFVEEIDTDEKL